MARDRFIMCKFLTLFLLCIFTLTGCATYNYTKQGVHYEEKAGKIKTVAVMPIDFKFFQISAGGVQEQMDESAAEAKKFIKEALVAHLGDRNIQLNFVDEASLKSTNKDTWFAQKGLYEAIASTALTHAYPGINGFKDKIDSFDYTMGEGISALPQTSQADALLFIQGYDTARTTGKVVMDAFIGALAGVYYYYFNPLNIGLVDPKTGDVLWFKTNNIMQEVDFRNAKAVDNLVKWLIEDLLIKK